MSAIHQEGGDSLNQPSIARQVSVNIEDPHSEGLLGPDDSTVLHHGTAVVAGAEFKFTGEYPEHLSFNGLTFVVPGFGGFKTSSRGLRHQMALRGFPTYTFEPVRLSNSSNWKNITEAQELHIHTLAAMTTAIQTDTSIAKKMPNGKAIEKGRKLWLPHSMSGLSVPEHVWGNASEEDVIVNLSAAGYGSPTPPQLLKTIPGGVKSGIIHELIPYVFSETSLSPKDAIKAIRYYCRVPSRTIGEALSCLRTDIRPLTNLLRESGVRTSYLAAEYDIVIPSNDAIAQSVDHYRVMRNLGHMGPQVKPNKVAAHVVDVVLSEFALIP